MDTGQVNPPRISECGSVRLEAKQDNTYAFACFRNEAFSSSYGLPLKIDARGCPRTDDWSAGRWFDRPAGSAAALPYTRCESSRLLGTVLPRFQCRFDFLRSVLDVIVCLLVLDDFGTLEGG